MVSIETVRLDLEAIEMTERKQRQNLNYIEYLEKRMSLSIRMYE
jgi:hypothetical protein